MASVPVKRLGEVEHGLEISLCRYQVQFRYDTVSDILFRYVIGRGETGAFENGELRMSLSLREFRPRYDEVSRIAR